MRCPRRSDPHRTSRGRGGGRTTGRGAIGTTNGPAGSPADDGGAVTVEAALALGTLVAVTAAAVGAVAAVAAGVRCTDAARELARQAARGDTDRGRAVAAQLAPAGAEPELRLDGDLVVVTVRVRPVELLPVTISGTASAAVEPGVTTGAARSGVEARPGVTAGSARPGGAS
ncbi:TadE family type IV pilus minor pilin [Pseudonocardia tropica]|uniref:TadE family type IV pilus minor pilin n=1 Tax=Pseudonocardia tropica TaxID=681289 RepID=A0ABV1JS02_9PSEU